MTDKIVNQIRIMRAGIEQYKYLIAEQEQTIAVLREQLPKLYYLEFNGGNGYEEGIPFVGSREECVNQVENVFHLLMVNNMQFALEDKVGQNVTGHIRSCTPVDYEWDKVYALSQVKT